MTKSSQINSQLFLDLLEVDVTRGRIAHNFLRLKEGSIYSIKNFVVHPNKEEFRIMKHDTFMLDFDRLTTIRKASVSAVVPQISFQVGQRTRNQAQEHLTFTLPTTGGSHLGTIWGGLGDVLIEKKTKHVVMCTVVLTLMSAKNYNNKLYLSSCSLTVIYDDENIPALQELKKENTVIEQTNNGLRADLSEPKEGTLENMLIWAQNRKNDSATFHCKVMIENIRTRKGWNYPSCGGDNCKKVLPVKLENSFAKHVTRPLSILYKLELGAANDTEHAVVIVFDEPATELLHCSVESLLEMVDESTDDDSGLPTAITNLICMTHMLELKSHTYYEYGTFESFTYWKINPSSPIDEGAGSSTVDVIADNPSPSFKRLSKPPSMSTPSKGAEENKKKRSELEDSDTDEVCGPSNEADGCKADDSKDKKKRKNPLCVYMTDPVNDPTSTPSLSTLLHNTVFIQSNTTIRHDGIVQSYCCIRLSEINAICLGPAAALVRLLDRAITNLNQSTRELTSKYAYRLKGNQQQRKNQGNSLLRGGRLFQQYWVDAYTAVEKQRLKWTRNNQDTLRVDLYHNLCDAVTRGDTSAEGLGKRIILPKSFTCSPRYMMQNYQDAMALCRACGNPNLIITFTSNPKWLEIAEMLAYFTGKISNDRPKIGTRVFKIKLTELLDDLTKNDIFGETQALVYVIEFQKRGLPHAHILLWLEEHCKCTTPSQIDDIISAELPSPIHDPCRN
ncbi:DNA helicase PIF1, ATP-dependent [Tanacetum coccineum]